MKRDVLQFFSNRSLTGSWIPLEIILTEARALHTFDHSAHLLVVDMERSTDAHHHLFVGRARLSVIPQLQTEVYERGVIVVGVENAHDHRVIGVSQQAVLEYIVAVTVYTLAIPIAGSSKIVEDTRYM